MNDTLFSLFTHFSPACNCHNLGSLDPFCRETDGQCNCAENAYGRRCNECQPGYWNFPDCQPCQCNGHANICEAQTGECIDCRDWTGGFACDTCLEGYYGDPRLGVDIPCRECPCPNTKASGHSFADRCYLDSTNNEPVCECDEGYSGNGYSVLLTVSRVIALQKQFSSYFFVL